MRALGIDNVADCLEPFDVLLPGGDYAAVEHPKIQHVLRILRLADGVAAGDAADIRRLWRVLAEWLPPPVFEALQALGPEGALRAAGSWINTTSTAAAPGRPAQEQADESGAFDFFNALADYCDVFGGTAEEVARSGTWHFFLAALAKSNAAVARSTLRWLDSQLIPHVGKGAGKILDRLKTAAGEGARAGKPRTEYEKWNPPQEVLDRNLADFMLQMGG